MNLALRVEDFLTAVNVRRFTRRVGFPTYEDEWDVILGEDAFIRADRQAL